MTTWSRIQRMILIKGNSIRHYNTIDTTQIHDVHWSTTFRSMSCFPAVFTCYARIGGDYSTVFWLSILYVKYQLGFATDFIGDNLLNFIIGYRR